MAELVYADLVCEMTTTTGTGPVSLVGAVDGARSFASALNEADQFYYLIEGAPTDDSLFELGIGTFTSGAVSRAAFLSSNGTGALDLPAGVKTISLTVAAAFYNRVEAHDVFAAWRAIPGNETATMAEFLDAILNVGDGPKRANLFELKVQQPATPALGTSQTALMFNTPSRDEAGVASGIKFGLSYAHHPFAANAHGPGHAQYTNNVLGLSWNLTPVWNLIKPTMGGPSFRIEARYKVLSREPGKTDQWVDGSEFHDSMRTVDGTEWRPFTHFAPFADAEWGHNSDMQLMSAYLVLKDGWGDPQITHAWNKAKNGERPIYYAANTSIIHDGNNRPIVQQRNAAGASYISLPYIDNKDSYRFNRDVFASVDTPKPNAYGIQSLCTMVASAGMAAEGRLMFLTSNAVTGTLYGTSVQASVSQAFEGVRIHNTHASGTAGVQLVAKGNSYVGFEDQGNNRHFGLRLKPDGKFVIGTQYRGGDHGSGDAIRVNVATLQTEFVKPPKLPSGTVAATGAAATAGAGALAYVSDLSATTSGTVAAGGGSNKGVVVSDGSDWRILTAW